MDKAKRGYQEKKQILQKHVQTEKTLTNQAKQLMDVANTATKDVNKLHETIARRKNYDYNNREACKNLDSNLNNHFNSMTNNVAEYKTTLNDHTLQLISKMGKRQLPQYLQSFNLRSHWFTTGVLLVIRCKHKTK